MEDSKSNPNTKKSSADEETITDSIYDMAEFYLEKVEKEGKFVINCEDAFLKALERLPVDDFKRVGRSHYGLGTAYLKQAENEERKENKKLKLEKAEKNFQNIMDRLRRVTGKFKEDKDEIFALANYGLGCCRIAQSFMESDNVKWNEKTTKAAKELNLASSIFERLGNKEMVKRIFEKNSELGKLVCIYMLNGNSLPANLMI